MATGIGATGKAVGSGDAVTINGTVSAISGSGGNASVTVNVSGSSIVVKASDCYAPMTSGAAISIDGKPFGVGSTVSIPGVCTAVSGSGSTATLTTSVSSGASVAHPSTAVNHPHAR